MNELKCAHAPIHTHIPNISLPNVTKQKKQGRKEQVQITLTKTDLITIHSYLECYINCWPAALDQSFTKSLYRSGVFTVLPALVNFVGVPAVSELLWSS